MHRELRIRADQQQAVARLGEFALVETDLQKIFDETVRTIASILDVEMVKILELVPGDAELLLRAGTGWKPGVVGSALISTRPELGMPDSPLKPTARSTPRISRSKLDLVDSPFCTTMASDLD